MSTLIKNPLVGKYKKEKFGAKNILKNINTVIPITLISDTAPTPAPGAISQWVVDDLTVGTANTELWANRVPSKPSLQRGDGIGKTRVVEVDAAFGGHKVVNNVHVSGNQETEWCIGTEIESSDSSYTMMFVCNIVGYDTVNNSHFISAYNLGTTTWRLIWRSTKVGSPSHWGQIYTGINPFWKFAGLIGLMLAGNTHIYTLELDKVTGHGQAYIDNDITAFIYNDRWTGGDNLGDNCGIFGGYNTGIADGLYGRFAECRIYNTVLSDDDRNTAINELKTTYGIS